DWLLELVCDNPVPPGAPGSATSVAPSAADLKLAADEIEGQLFAVRHARIGTRNHVLNTAAFICGKLVAAEATSEEQVTNDLMAAAEAVGLTRREAIRTIGSGMNAGKRHPWRPRAGNEALASVNRDYFYAVDGKSGFVIREDVDPITGHR